MVLLHEGRLDVAYQELSRELQEQSSEMARVDNKATALLTPIGVIIGLAINSAASLRVHWWVVVLLYLGLLALVGAMTFGVATLWPRASFQSLSPGVDRPGDGRNKALRVIGSIVGTAVRPSTEWKREQYSEPSWLYQSREDTLDQLISYQSACYRVNTVMKQAKIAKLHRQFALMVIGTGLIALWFLLAKL